MPPQCLRLGREKGTFRAMKAETAHECPLRPLDPLPRWTSATPGVGGRARVEVEDFVVDETPLYAPCGEGDHLYLHVEKRDLSGPMLRRQLATLLGVQQGDIGMAGLKDRRAVTRQWISVPVRGSGDPLAIEDSRIRVLAAIRHTNKLRTGHLAGNLFVVRLRDLDGDPQTLPARVSGKLGVLRDVGMPNFYGQQRMGHGGSTLAAGWALGHGHDGHVRIRTPDDVVHQIQLRDRTLRRLAASALQSEIFNHIVATRMAQGTLDRVLLGDVCRKTDTGGSFVSDDPDRDGERLARGEVELTGPMWGPKMMMAGGAVAELEREILDAAGLDDAVFRRLGSLAMGTRRAMVCKPENLEATLDEEGLVLRFGLPPGAFATVLMHEFSGPTEGHGVVTPCA